MCSRRPQTGEGNRHGRIKDDSGGGPINQSIFQFYVCSHQGDIRQTNTETTKKISVAPSGCPGEMLTGSATPQWRVLLWKQPNKVFILFSFRKREVLRLTRTGWSRVTMRSDNISVSGGTRGRPGWIDWNSVKYICSQNRQVISSRGV